MTDEDYLTSITSYSALVCSELEALMAEYSTEQFFEQYGDIKTNAEEAQIHG